MEDNRVKKTCKSCNKSAYRICMVCWQPLCEDHILFDFEGISWGESMVPVNNWPRIICRDCRNLNK